MESISQLKQITQSEKRAIQSARYTLLRDLSIYVTWALLHTPISANQVTLLSIMFGLAGVALVALGSPLFGLLGCGLVWGYILLDKVDGEVARYRRAQSLRGILLDEIGHLMIKPLLFAGLAIHVYMSTGSVAALLLGYVPALQVGWARVLVNLPYRIFSKKAVVQPIPPVQPADLARAALGKRLDRAGAPLFKLLRLFQNFYWTLGLIMLACLLDWLLPLSRLVGWSSGSWAFGFLLLVTCCQSALFVKAAVLAFLSFEADVGKVDQQVRVAYESKPLERQAIEQEVHA
jgi:hypothetical protein